MELLAFILVSAGLIAVPGPNVLVIVSTSITQGKLRGLQTVAGTSVAMAIQLLVAALGTTWFVSAITQGFVWLKWAGVAYLVYLGIGQLVRATSSKPTPQISAIGSFQRGFWVSLTNPKTILFFSAFLPQFTLSSASYLPQIALLSLIFWVLAVVLDSGYALLSNKLGTFFRNKSLTKVQGYTSGLIYLGAGTALAASKHGQ